MGEFTGIIHKEREGDYGVSFPDFPGCITAGGSLQEAFEMAREALQGHIDTMYEYGDTLPARPLNLDQAKKHPLAKGAEVFFMVHADLPVKCRRINVTLDERLIEQIDQVTANRSGFLAEAAREKLKHV